MTHLLPVEFTVTLDDSHEFAQLSGDFNPLHLDPVAARRSMFGGTVAHGMHVALRACELLSEHCLPAGTEPAAVTASFSNPLRSGQRVRARGQSIAANRFRITAEADGRPVLSLSMTTRMATLTAATPHTPSASESPYPVPRVQEFPPLVQIGAVHGDIDSELLLQLFPLLADRGDTRWLADLLATTRIVGMECPGMHSVFSGFKLMRRPDGEIGTSAQMRYFVEKTDVRFRMARIGVVGGYFTGTLDTFFRPPPVEQPALASIMTSVAAETFASRRALIVGGSRGLGEVAAKLLIAGGADVTITYARGFSEASRLQKEARDCGFDCNIKKLDASDSLRTEDREWLASGNFSLVCYFASPHIEKNVSESWDEASFQKFVAVYVKGFAAAVGALVRGHASTGEPLRVLYPSSVFLDHQEPGFSEYCAAKAAGESLARHLSRSGRVDVSIPRLPRMRTDQTSSLTHLDVADPYPIILQALRGLARC